MGEQMDNEQDRITEPQDALPPISLADLPGIMQAAAGRAAILVPYPFAAADHQTQNARSLADAGGAEVIADKDLDHVSLLQEAAALLNDTNTLRHMGKASRNFARPEAAGHIADRVIALGDKR